MKNPYYINLENISPQDRIDINDAIDHLVLNEDGLFPVITQCTQTREVLMMAWMNVDTFRETMDSRRMVYWSRSRKQPWRKGETSGSVQNLQHLYIDCDGDAVLCLVDQVGEACHTKRPSCFYLQVDLDNKQVKLKD